MRSTNSGKREKPTGSRLAISNQIYGAVMSLPDAERTSRQAVNAAVEDWAALRRRGQTVWVYLNDFEHGHQRKPGDPDWVKLFGSDDAADRWLQNHDPEGVTWEYKVEDGPRRASLWICVSDSTAIGDPDWLSYSSPGKPQNNGSSRTLPRARFGTIHLMSKKREHVR